MSSIGINIGTALKGGQGFSPFAVGRPIALLDAALGITLNGADVSNWADQSGEGNDVLQGTTADQPLWNSSDSDFNGNPSVEFDGVTEDLESAVFAGGDLIQPNTIIGVYKMADVVGTQVMWDSLTFPKRNAFNTVAAQAVLFAAANQNIHTEDTNPHILMALYNGASSDSWHDGTQSTPAGSVGANVSDGITLGADINGGTNAAVKFAYFLIYNKELTAAERNYIGRGFAARFGTTDGWS